MALKKGFCGVPTTKALVEDVLRNSHFRALELGVVAFSIRALELGEPVLLAGRGTTFSILITPKSHTVPSFAHL